MARVSLVRVKINDPYVYNIDFSVGPGSPNKRDDVLLVQYFLKSINDKRDSANPPFAPLPLAPGEVFKVDGIAGPITFRAIKHFQDQALQRGRSITPDGRVDKVTRTNSPNTMSVLNNFFTILRKNDFANIAMASDCPADLKGSVSLL